LPIDGLTIEDLCIRAAELHPDIVFHQYNEPARRRAGDVHAVIGEKRPDVPAKLDQAHAISARKFPNSAPIPAGGATEAIIGGYYDAVAGDKRAGQPGRPHVLDRFYTRQTTACDYRWFTAAVTGKPVETWLAWMRAPEHHGNARVSG